MLGKGTSTHNFRILRKGERSATHQTNNVEGMKIECNPSSISLDIPDPLCYSIENRMHVHLWNGTFRNGVQVERCYEVRNPYPRCPPLPGIG